MDKDEIELRYPGDYPVFFIGASAGGVKALQAIAGELPENFPAPVFMLLHRKRTTSETKDLLGALIQNKTRLNVTPPKEGDPVKAGHIYLPVPGRHLAVSDNSIRLSSQPDDGIWRPSIDTLFKSAAEEYGERAVCILLTGGLKDGIEGLQRTTKAGGITAVQSPEDAFDPRLPMNALLYDHPVYVMPLSDVVALMCELCNFDFSPEQKQISIRAAILAEKKREAIRRVRKQS